MEVAGSLDSLLELLEVGKVNSRLPCDTLERLEPFIRSPCKQAVASQMVDILLDTAGRMEDEVVLRKEAKGVVKIQDTLRNLLRLSLQQRQSQSQLFTQYFIHYFY